MKFKIGDRVKIVTMGDNVFPRITDVGDSPYVGRLGRVKRLIEGRPSTVGETPESPLVLVAVPFVGTDGFWPEELEDA